MKKTIEEYNDLLSVKYDEATQGGFKWLPPSRLARSIKPYIKPDMDVLDIGVGTGQTSEIFIAQGARVVGIDISEKMLAIAKSKFNFKKLIKYNIEEGLLNLFSREKFDIIVSIGILEFVSDIKRVLLEMKGLLKKDGIIIFTYEIYEPNNTYGIKKVAPLGSGLENAPKLLNFNVYRRTSDEVDNIIKDFSLQIVKRETFIGYLRSQLKIPVPYELLIVK